MSEFATTAHERDSALETAHRGHEGGNNLLDGLRGIGQFIHALQTRLRFGKASRLPLRLLRIELKGSTVECDWIARPPDAWDADIHHGVSEHNASMQALDDALAVRQLVFSSLPDVRTAVLRAYRKSVPAAGLIIEGTVSPGDGTVRVLSLAMRAKLNGFRFCIENGMLQPLPEE
jgi:hypothetical protein